MSDPTPVPLTTLLAHREWVRRVAIALVGDGARADDLEQDLWVKVLRSPPSIRGSLRGWIAAVMRNEHLNRRRGEERSALRERELARPAEEPSAADLVADAEALRRVVDAVLALPEPYRGAVLMRYYRDVPASEIARREGVPVETVRTRLKRAIAKLRAALEERDGRRGLAVLLAPLVRPGGAAVAGGALMAKKALVAAAVAAALCLLWLLPRGPASDDSSPRRADLAVGTVTPVGPTPRTARVRPEVPSVPAARAEQDGSQVDVTVRVLGPDGAPVEGAVVEASRAQRGEDVHNSQMRRGQLVSFDVRSPDRTAATDARGAAAFRLPARQGWAFAATKPGFSRATSSTPGWGGGVDLSRSGGAAEVVLRMGRECTLEGRVLDEERRPVAGVVVAVTAGHMYDLDGHTAVRATSEADGRFSVRSLRPGPGRLQAILEGHVAAESAVQLPYAAQLEVVVRTPGRFRGRLLDDADGSPVAGALVRVSTSGFGGIAESRSGEDGAWSVPWCLEAPVGRVVVEHEDYVSPPWSELVWIPARGVVTRDFRLARGGRIRGVVRGDGRPLAGAEITATTGREPEGVWVLPVRSDGEGRFEMKPLGAGPVVVHAKLAGWYAAEHPLGRWKEALLAGGSPSQWRVELNAGEVLEHDLSLTRGATVEGVVVTSDGSPLAGASVSSLQSDLGWMRCFATASADGSFRLEGVAPDRSASVWATAPGWCLDTDAVAADPSAKERVVLRMVPPVPVAGIVLDADGASPPAGTRVTASIDLPRNERSGLGVPDFAPSVLAGPDGRFELPVCAPALSKIAVHVTAPGRGAAGAGPFGTDELRAGRRVEVRLAPAEILRGRVVVRGTSSPVAGATVRTDFAGGPPTARTDALGAFRIEGREPWVSAGAERRIYVAADGFGLGRATAPPGAADVVIELDPVFEISGNARFPDGTAAEGARVSAERQGRVAGSWFDFGEPGIGPFRAEATADGSGAFRLRGLPAGRYVVLAAPPKGQSARMAPGRSAPVEAGARDVLVLVAPRDGAVASELDEMSDGDLGRDAIWRLMQKDAEGAAAAWQALLARPLPDDARAEAMALYANGALRSLGRRDEAVRILEAAAALPDVGDLRLAGIRLDLATVLVELDRLPEALAAAREAVAGAEGKDPLLCAFARARAAQARSRLGEPGAREELERLRVEIGDRRDGGWPSLRAIVEAELRR